MKRDIDHAVAAWLSERSGGGAPAGLLDRVLETTRQQRPRPALLARIGGHHLSPTAPGVLRVWKGRTMNGPLRLILAGAAVAVAFAVGVAVFGPPRDRGVGTLATPTPSSSLPTASPDASSPAPTDEGALLTPGRHSSVNYIPGFAFVVPEGWRDKGGDGVGYMLEGPDGGIVQLLRDRVVGSNANDCEGLAVEGAATSADGIIETLVADPRFDSSAPEPVTMGALAGEAIDIGLAPDWTGTCKWAPDGQPAAILVTDPSPPGPFVGLAGDERMHLILLQVGDGTVAILVEQPYFDDQARAVVDSFEFDR